MENVFTGNLPIEVKVTACKEPKPERLLRKLDTNFVKGLKARMKADPIAPGIPPVALHCVDIPKKTDFLKHLANQYSYEVLGGLHTIAARKELMEEIPGMLRNYSPLPESEFHLYTYAYLNVYCGIKHTGQDFENC